VLATIKTMHDPFVVTLEHSKTRRRASHTCLAPYIVAPSSARGQSKAALPIVIRFGRGDCGHRQELSTHDIMTRRPDDRGRTYTTVVTTLAAAPRDRSAIVVVSVFNLLKNHIHRRPSIDRSFFFPGRLGLSCQSGDAK
jgi:hypothetical protein